MTESIPLFVSTRDKCLAVRSLVRSGTVFGRQRVNRIVALGVLSLERAINYLLGHIYTLQRVIAKPRSGLSDLHRSLVNSWPVQPLDYL